MATFPNAPTPLSYGAPQLSFDGLDKIGENYFQGAEQRRKYDLARAFQGGIPKKPDGTPDFAAMGDILAQHGAAEQVIPFSNQAVEQEQRSALQGALAPGGGAGAFPQPGGTQPSTSAPSQPVGVPPRGERNNNPGNLEASRFTQSQPGYVGSDGRFGQFDKTESGVAAAGKLLETYGKQGVTTVNGIISKWAPSNDGNNVGQYAAFVAKQAGVGPNDPIDLSDPQTRSKVLRGMFMFENGKNTPAAQQVGGQTGLLLPPGVDPRQAIDRLRAQGDRLTAVGGAQGARAAQQFYDRADKIESDAFGEVQRGQGNINRAFAETQRQHGVAEMTPVTIGMGTFGEEIKGVKDPASGGFRLIDPKTGQLGQGNNSAPIETGISAKDLEFDKKAGRNVEYLQSLDPERQGIVRKMANYEMNPSSLSIKGGHRERVLAAVAQFDPNYDQKNYVAFSDGLKKFQSGKEGSGVRSFNVGIEHIDQLLELGRALDNGNIPKINELKNWVKTNIGEDAPTNFNGLKAIVGAEIVKAIVGAGGTGEERAAAARTVSGASSMKQLEGIAKTYASAMGAQLAGLQRQYEQSTGRRDFDRLLSPQAIRARDSHNAPHGGGGVSARPANDGWSVKEIK